MIDNELKKIKAVTTLCHLCTLQQLEEWAEKAKQDNYKPKQTNRNTPREQHPDDTTSQKKQEYPLL